MKKSLLFTMMLLYSLFSIAQDGNTIYDAIEVDGVAVAINVLDFNSATASGLLPACGSTEDVFYKHTTNVGDNKLTIGMASAGVSLITDVEYQIIEAPNGDLSQKQVLDCDAYTVLLVVGGSFQFVIEDMSASNTYYLRVYKTSGLGGSLTNLLNGTTITMDSEFDSTLSTVNVNSSEFKFVVKEDEINLYNNTSYNEYSIYALDGKQILNEEKRDVLNSIDISTLAKGIYVMNLKNDNSYNTYKFVKY